MSTFLKLVSGKIKQITAIVTSTGAPDAGKLVALDGAGRWDSSLMPVGFGAETKTIEASENLATGDFVNIHNSTGIKVRKADASNGRVAHGYVLAAVTSGQNATVYYGNINNQKSGLTIGVEYELSNTVPGGIAAVGTQTLTTGHISQKLGVATAATELLAEIQQEIEIA
jgi:hypothetical protein